MVYTFARMSAVLGLDVSGYYQNGRRMIFGFEEKGGRYHEMPAAENDEDVPPHRI